MAAAEDDGDRRAMAGVQAELFQDQQEFEDAGRKENLKDGEEEGSGDNELGTVVKENPRPTTTVNAVSIDNAAVQPLPDAEQTSVTEILSEEARLTVQLAKLQPIDRQALAVLERYLKPLYASQLAEARTASSADTAPLVSISTTSLSRSVRCSTRALSTT